MLSLTMWLMQPQHNSVGLSDEGFVEIHVIGDQTVDSVQTMGDEALVLCRAQRETGRQALILDNLLRIGHVPAEARGRVIELVKSLDYDRLAMVGSNPMIRFGANLMLQATGKGSKVRYFDDRAAAAVWLRRP